MKILQANKFFFRNGGSETVMFQERDFLLANGHEVIDFSMQDERNFSSQQSIYFVNNRSYKNQHRNPVAKLMDAVSFIHSNEAVNKITKLISKTNPDIVHCHNIYHQLTPSIIGAAKKMGVPVVLTLHDSKPVCPSYYRVRESKPCSDCLDGDFFNVVRHRCADGALGKSALLYAEAVIQKLIGSYEKVDTFIAPSKFMQTSVARRIPIDHIKLLYNGIDTNEIKGGNLDEGYVLFLGRLVPEKGIETLLKAHEKSNHAWPLVVAGTGPLLDVLKAQHKSVIFTGHLAGDALKDIIKKCSVVVVPSEIYENCPMTVLEGMAYSKPVVGSRLGGTLELIEDEITGLTFDAGDEQMLMSALNRLMSASKLRNSFGIAGRQRVEQYFSLEKHHADLLGIYQSVLGVK